MNVSYALGSAIDSAAGHASSAIDKAAGATAAGSRSVAAADPQQKQLLSAGQAAAAAVEQLSGGVAEGLKAAASLEGWRGLEGSVDQGMDQMRGESCWGDIYGLVAIAGRANKVEQLH